MTFRPEKVFSTAVCELQKNVHQHKLKDDAGHEIIARQTSSSNIIHSK